MIQKKWLLSTALIALGGVLTPGVSQAAVIVADNALREIGSGHADAYLRPASTPGGHTGAALRSYNKDAAGVYSTMLIFVLPDLAGESVVSADLAAFGATNLAHNTFNSAVDLYGVRFQANTAATSDTEVSEALDAHTSLAYAASGNNGTGIMDDFLPVSNTSAVNGVYSTDATADIALGAWLQSLYDGGAVAGDYAFLRLNPDTNNGTVFGRGWNVNSADNASNPPVLTITTAAVPEPASLALIGMGSLMMLARRRTA